MERTVRTPDGRTLAVEDTGDPGGRPVLVHMGTPNSRLLFGPHVTDAIERGIRLICYDRPGYGGSSPHPGRTVADCAADVRAICATLGIDRLAMWGISGGGPHVLACAALLPDLVVAAASLASPAPMEAEGLDWFDGMGELNVEDVQLTKADPEAARAKTETDRLEILETSAEDLAASLQSVLTPVDAAALSGEVAEYLTRANRAGLAPGIEGWWEDAIAMDTSDWGFDLRSISIPLLLMHGRHDRFVPFAHGEWLAGQIPGVEARLLDHDGHLTLPKNRIGEVHAWLLAHLER
ncbi:MAG TPA: alpha/beta fold hydrolase [Streptosporangiaceae bacterium]|jgi:pimeloyl-ACP methyl ester carboxylesterase|nr:alpha/beta fold hydrolase [Streptosporangiaceae bacterium]